MITFLSSPKAFEGKTLIDQTRAIRSWMSVHPDVEVILFGKALGAKELSEELGFVYCPEVDTAESGVPLFNAIVQMAQTRAKHDLQVYLNCDIILTPYFYSAMGPMPWKRFLVIGQRITVDKQVSIDVSNYDILIELNRLASIGKVRLGSPNAIDYFMFPRGLWHSLPPVIIGRAFYDGALLAHCLRNNIPIVDATFSSPVLHPEHEYQHVKGGKSEVWKGHDAKLNQRRNGIKHSSPSTSDAQWRIEAGVITKNTGRQDWLRALELKCRFVWGIPMIGLGMRIVWRVFRAIGLVKPADPPTQYRIEPNESQLRFAED
jgi:hypothetical protein